MEYVYTSDLDELSMEEEENSRGKTIRSHNSKNSIDNNDCKFKSKNLNAERKRRAKLNDKLLQLRTSVPIITNMNKATIIKDAITYIEELQRNVSDLSNELLELGKPNDHDDETKPTTNESNANPTEEMKNWGIEPEVEVFPINENKLWIKVVYQKKLGGLTKLVETITDRLEYEFNDVNLTTSKGAAVLTCSLEGMFDGSIDIEETKECLLNVITDL